MNMEKPDIVKKAILILWITLGIGAVRFLIGFSLISQQVTTVGGKWFVCFVALFFCAFMVLLIYLLGKRKNWARWLCVILIFLGAPFSVNPLIQSLRQEPISGILGITQGVAQIAAAVFLLLAPSRAWYKKQSQQITL